MTSKSMFKGASARRGVVDISGSNPDALNKKPKLSRKELIEKVGDVFPGISDEGASRFVDFLKVKGEDNEK